MPYAAWDTCARPGSNRILNLDINVENVSAPMEHCGKIQLFSTPASPPGVLKGLRMPHSL